MTTLFDNVPEQPRPPERSHPTHRMHAHSLASWRDLNLKGRKYEVCAVLALFKRPMTDREVCEALGRGDMNYASPAITHLVDEGVLAEVGSIKCPVTGRTVRQVWLKEAA